MRLVSCSHINWKFYRVAARMLRYLFILFPLLCTLGLTLKPVPNRSGIDGGETSGYTSIRFRFDSTIPIFRVVQFTVSTQRAEQIRVTHHPRLLASSSWLECWSTKLVHNLCIVPNVGQWLQSNSCSHLFDHLQLFRKARKQLTPERWWMQMLRYEHAPRIHPVTLAEPF